MCTLVGLLVLSCETVFHESQAGLELTMCLNLTWTPDPPTSIFRALGLEACATTPSLCRAGTELWALCMLREGSTNWAIAQSWICTLNHSIIWLIHLNKVVKRAGKQTRGRERRGRGWLHIIQLNDFQCHHELCLGETCADTNVQVGLKRTPQKTQKLLTPKSRLFSRRVL